MNALVVNCMPTPSPELISRFDVAGPRYTSYPTADRFVEAFTADHLSQALVATVAVRAQSLLRVAVLLLRLQQDRHQAP